MGGTRQVTGGRDDLGQRMHPRRNGHGDGAFDEAAEKPYPAVTLSPETVSYTNSAMSDLFGERRTKHQLIDSTLRAVVAVMGTLFIAYFAPQAAGFQGLIATLGIAITLFSMFAIRMHRVAINKLEWDIYFAQEFLSRHNVDTSCTRVDRPQELGLVTIPMLAHMIFIGVWSCIWIFF